MATSAGTARTTNPNVASLELQIGTLSATNNVAPGEKFKVRNNKRKAEDVLMDASNNRVTDDQAGDDNDHAPKRWATMVCAAV